MPRRRRHRQSADSNLTERERIEREETAAEDRPVRRRRKGKSGWGRRMLLLMVLLLLLVGLLPNLIGWTGMHQRLIDWGTKDFAGRVTVQSVRTGWFQPVVLTGVQATDTDGKVLLSVEKIETSNRLYNFLTSSDYGNVSIQRPVVNATMRNGGSNLEDAIAKFTQTGPNKPEAPASPLAKMQILIREGTVNLNSATDPAVRTIDGIEASVQTGGTAAIVALAKLKNGSAPGGTLSLDATIDNGANQLKMDNGQVALAAQQFDIAVLAPALERVFGKCETAGILEGVVKASFSENGNAATADFGQASIQKMRLAAQDLIGPDLVTIEKLLASGQASLDSKGVSASRLSITSDVGTLQAEGKMAWQQLARLISDGQLANTPFQLDGQIDIARLASMLPSTLTLHEDLKFESGLLKFNVNSHDDNGVPRVVANLDTINLAARRGADQIVWKQPLRFVSTISQRNGQTQIEELLCESDFLAIRGSGNPGSARFTAEGDLAKLMQRLRQFATLEGWQLAGTLQGEFSCQTEGSQAVGNAADLLGRPIRIAGDFLLTNPVIQLPGVAAWAEPELRLILNATALAASDGAVSIQQGMTQMLLGTDVASMRLVEPIQNISVARSYRVEAAAKGQLNRWIGLVRNFVDIGTFKTDGNGTVSATVQVDSSKLVASGLQYKFDQFSFDGYGMKIQEDQISGAGGLEFDLGTGTLNADNLTLVSSSVAAVAQKASVSYGSHLAASGQIGVRGDVHRIAGWFGLSDPEDTIQYFGNLEGNITLGSTGEFINGQVQAVIKDMVAARPDFQLQKWVELHREANVDVTGEVGLSQSFNDMKLTGVRIQADSVSAQINGMIRDLAGAFNMELDGNWSPDWQKIDGLLAAYSGNMVKLTGHDSQAFSVRGPLFAVGADAANATAFLPANTQIASEIKWEQGNVFLLPVGPARIQGALAGSVAKINTGEIPFGGGTLKVQPEIDLGSASPVVNIAAGNVASNIKLTPEFCHDWMKYVAPLLADATTAEGSFSVKTGGASIPLNNVNAATANGAVTLHNVTVGAGPLAQQLLQKVETVRTLLKPDAGPAKDRSVWMNLGEQEIPFAVQNGRVYHEGLKLQMKDLQVSTSGSVGLDQSLSMVATIPIHDDWLNGQKWLEGLRGQKLEIPISGTVSKPVLDDGAIRQLTGQLGQRVAQQVIGEQTAKLQEKAASEINQFQEKIQGKLQGGVQDLQNKAQEKLQGEVFKGLNNLFGPKPPAGGGG